MAHRWALVMNGPCVLEKNMRSIDVGYDIL